MKKISAPREKAQKGLTTGEKEELRQSGETFTLAFAGQEICIIDVITSKEKLLFKGGAVIGFSQDNEWVYVRDIGNNKVYKINVENPALKEELLSFYYPLLRIESENPLRFGFPHPPLFKLGVFTPPSAFRCYCYEKKNDTLVLKKIIKIGDNKFPSDARLSILPNGSYVLAISKKGFYLKEMASGALRKIDNSSPFMYTCNGDCTKLAYVKKSKNGYEIWFYDILSKKKQILFPE